MFQLFLLIPLLFAEELPANYSNSTTLDPSASPSSLLTSVEPSLKPSGSPSTLEPTYTPTYKPSFSPSAFPSHFPSYVPTSQHVPSFDPSANPTSATTSSQQDVPSFFPSAGPTPAATLGETEPNEITEKPTFKPTTVSPSLFPTVDYSPTKRPTGTLCTTAHEGAVKYCHDSRDGLCVQSLLACAALGGFINENIINSGCNHKYDSGCFCCRGVLDPDELDPEQSDQKPSSSKSKRENDDTASLIWLWILIALVTLILTALFIARYFGLLGTDGRDKVGEQEMRPFTDGQKEENNIPYSDENKSSELINPMAASSESEMI
mmetsp:Transcript_15261/g.20201  ORF Transcript_15261/g.20201 Transcript_15261/m.20201 type:complete len:321 (+) Transcript_15261:62-1024(+)